MKTHIPKRDESQIITAVATTRALMALVDECSAASDLTRSQFIRAALANELIRRGVKVDPAILRTPFRAGKGGPISSETPLTETHNSTGDGVAHGRGAKITNNIVKVVRMPAGKKVRTPDKRPYYDV